jgi:peptide chain release factor subunit 1
MISKQDLENLLERPGQPGSPVLSVYLDVDQSRAANLNRGFETALKSMLRSIEQQLAAERERAEFAADAERLLRFASDYQPRARSLVIFCDASQDFFWVWELHAPVRNDARWGGAPYVRPLLEALDEFERYGVILADRAQARLFTVFLGEVEEHREVFAPANVRHIRTTGTDHLWSQLHFQRKADEHARWHLKHIAELMDRLASVYAFDHLVLAGPIEVTSELYSLLPKRLRSRIAGSLALPIKASEPQVLEATLKIEQEVEQATKTRLVEGLITAAAKNEQAVTGLDAILMSLQQGRIWRLVYANGFARRGGQCTTCAALFVEDRNVCAYCGAAVASVDDIVARVAERVAEMSGKVEPVRGTAADRLKGAGGGIGAFLRF